MVFITRWGASGANRFFKWNPDGKGGPTLKKIIGAGCAMENSKSTLREEELSSAFKYGLKMLVRIAVVTHKPGSKAMQEISNVVRKRLEESKACSA